jgi:hypothetical protein
MHAPPIARVAALLGAGALFVCGTSAAQVHWDVGVQAGVLDRVQTGGAPGAPTPIPGPVGEVHAHVALVPLLRAGPYVAHDISPFPPSAGVPARQITEAGLRAKFSPPLLSGAWRTWALLGLGFARVYLPSHAVGSESVGGVEGGLLELPCGVGMGYRVRGARDPWLVTGELAARVGLAYFGPMYSDAPRDSLTLSLSVGVSFEE